MCLCSLQDVIIFGILLVILLCSSITNGALLPYKTLSLEEINLVRCLTYISHRYFAPGRTVVISSPAAYRDVQQELIAEIHHTCFWPVVNVDGNISKPNETEYIDEDNSYIILIQDETMFFLVSEIRGLYLYTSKFPRFCISDVRYVVAGAIEFSVSQQREIFRYLSYIGIYNCIILSRGHYKIDKKYSREINVNDVDTGMKLGVYAWFPYQSSDSCTEVNDITLLDSWVISAQGHFTKNTDLFPRKFSNKLNGCPMFVIAEKEKIYDINYSIQLNETNDTSVWFREKFGSNLLKVVLHQMNMTPVPLTEKSTESTELPFVGYRHAVFLGEMANMVYSFPNLELTSSYHLTDIHWYVPCSIKYQRWSSIFRILSVEL